VSAISVSDFGARRLDYGTHAGEYLDVAFVLRATCQAVLSVTQSL
jgi:hypothetical protein